MNKVLSLLCFGLTVILFNGCGHSTTEHMEATKIDVQGHRGCRGLKPENSLPAFEHALELGVTTLELDVVITADSQVVVSHEPFLSHEICSDTSGKRITEAQDKSFNIYKMTYEQLQQFDCGLQPHPRFPNQEKLAVTKPLLRTVIEQANAKAKELNRPLPYFNIETKCTPAGDTIFHPTPGIFTDLLVSVMMETGITERATLQSFDVRTLHYAHQHYPDIQLVLLVENKLGTKANLAELGFTPAVYSCDYNLLTEKDVVELQQQSMQVIPWTVNDTTDMSRLLDWGVDGIITDYPDRLMNLLAKRENYAVLHSVVN